MIDSLVSKPSKKSDFGPIKIQTKNLKPQISEAKISTEDLKQSIKLFFDDLEKGDKQSKILLSKKLNEIVNDNEGTF